jgi:MFS family permease
MTLGYAILFAMAILFLRNGRTYSSAKMEAGDAIKKMLRDRNLTHIYAISFALEFFYVIMIIYSPIYLRSIGISWEHIGLLFTAMLLPFVLLQYPLGLLADKRFGEKEFLIGSLAVGAVSVFCFGLVSSSSLLLLGVILFFTRVGAAGIEVLRDAYFYKQIDGGDDDLIAFFRTSRPTANILAAALAIPFLAFFPLQGVFFLAALVLSLAIIPAFALDDTPGEREVHSGSR